MSLQGNDHFLTPAHNWIHNWIWYWHPVMDPEVGPSLEYEYIVTQLPPGGYIYVKCWSGGLFFQAMPSRANKSKRKC